MAAAGSGGKKRVSNFKTTARSKRHKVGTSGTTPKSKSTSSSSSAKVDSLAPNKNGSAFPSDRKTRFEEKGRGKDGKDKKGKGPLRFIEIVGQKQSTRESKDDGQDDDDDADAGEGEEGSSQSEGNESEEDMGMLVDQDVDEQGGKFLVKLDKKGIATSRPAIKEAYRKQKPALQQAQQASAPTQTRLLDGIEIPEAGPTKSELKALRKKENRLKRLKGELPPLEEQDLDEEGVPRSGKEHPEGELIDDLEEDDLAFGSGDDDDDLSVMSELDEGTISTMSEMSDLDDEDDEGLWSEDDDDDDEDDSEEGDVTEWGGIADDGHVEVSASEDEDEDEDEDDEEDEEDASNVPEEKDYDSDEDNVDAIPLPRKRAKPTRPEDDLEAVWERRPKPPKPPKELPTKLPIVQNGKVIRSKETLEGARADEEEDEEEPEPRRSEPEYRSDPLGQRFGRPAVRQLLEIKDKKARIAKAREEIADLGREASGTGEGEGGLNLLKRLLSLTGPKFSSSSSARSAGERPILVDREIRVMAIISLLAVFVDVVPGYRIRALTAAEKEVKVSQMVARQREWEDGLVAVYKRFLEFCEAEVSAKDSPLSPVAIHCLCTLVREKPDFNYSVNIMDVIVKRLGRKGWDEGHQMCLEAVVHLFIHDTTTTASNSLHLVRLISRLVRARSFAVRPEVISTLLNLRLKDELGGGRVRASTEAVFREREGRKGVVKWNKEKSHKGRKGGKAKAAMDKKGSKKAREVRKERAKIDAEMREAEGEIDQQERERNQTETLKLLFALYFRIVKLDYRSPLLPAALEGLARFAHLINIDFFRDLLEVLKGIVKRGGILGAESVVTEEYEDDDEDGGDIEERTEATIRRNDMREKLLCIVTAFELLQGQGEALMIDLGDFVSALYALILPLSLSPTFEETPYLGRNSITTTNRITAKLAQTEADLLFRALAAIHLTPRSLPSPIRTLAFSKRLLSASLHWPAASQLRALTFLRSLLIREPKLEAMLETGDRRVDGKWKGAVDEPERAEPEGTCWWEAGLYRSHPDDKVRDEVKKLVNYQRE
ncbi:BZ3500_MvSof-1268-A1-R1_Chr2-2g05090 [Microbotryum saponariae]|uniref:BZ3500_MvSof-1268-A1-R1_Chr2-2g05090 protein n=1 Tax=Microbotryum saponariae TaxID=289078 RepID=A0A2X0M7K9_9BASI|nr:BZ3500_MvSof-1268-A1-R1_Chr2-2g05090 [Microbotryum saponariae]SDA00887.1 BZ3501_MvSof-1269-A2-R1_Chr2-2g04764 [Microbotryum saponariae]